jgi:hypothetical protein
MSNTEERRVDREDAQEKLLAPIKARRLEVLQELVAIAAERKSFADEQAQRWKELEERTNALVREGRALGLHMTAMTQAAGWKSRTSAYEALGVKDS